MFPWRANENTCANLNSFGRPTATVLPTPRPEIGREGILPRPEPIYPPNFRRETTNFQPSQIGEQMEQRMQTNDIQPIELIPNVIPGDNLTPMIL